jgi:hypothetical protein
VPTERLAADSIARSATPLDRTQPLDKWYPAVAAAAEMRSATIDVSNAVVRVFEQAVFTITPSVA